MQKYELGFNKKSFSLFYNGGSIWCEHLDSLCGERELVIKKFTQDLLTIEKPSTSSYIALNLDETVVDKDLLNYILNSFISLKRPIRKIAIVGLSYKLKWYVKRFRVNFEIKCIDDFEKAKEWLL